MKQTINMPIRICQFVAGLSLVLMLVCVFAFPVGAVPAIDNPFREVTWTYTDYQESTKNEFYGSYTIANTNIMFLVFYEHNGSYQLCEYIEEENTAYRMSWVGDHTGSPVSGVYRVAKDGKTTLELFYPTDSEESSKNIVNRFYTVPDLGNLTVNCNCYVFDSLESAEAFYKSGDISGIVSRPEPDYDFDHDFSKDTYDPDIPVPELSNLSYNGFHVNNADSTRDIDIYIESAFHGLNHLAPNTVNMPLGSSVNSSLYFQPNSSWKYATHRYNLTTPDVSYSDADIDISKMYRLDIVKDLTNDFKNWSSEYSSHKKLPDYSFLAHGASAYTTYYQRCHLYSSSTGSSDAAKLKISGQASVVYYVRFCQYIPGSGYTYGKWIAYTYTGRTSGVKDDVIIGDVEIDPDTGKPTITDPQPGKQDPSTGDIDYGGASDIDSSDLWATIKSLVNDMGAIPEIIGEVLSFLPSWILYMIAAGIAACVVLRFVGR